MKDKRSNYIRNYATLVFYVTFSVCFSFSQNSDNLRPSIKTVVIDAGHGGKDPGCHGHSAHEKNVCLSMALKLGAMINKKYPTIKVIFTRNTDVFVELDERAKIANRNKADLFICIHANASAEVVYGVETYVLGLHKTEAQQLIAERENSTIFLEEDKGAKYKDFDLSPDALIARQIQLSVFLDQSISFATKIQAEFKRIGRSDRGVKQAGFLVLYKTTMPSVLIETGFLTNTNEEKFLSDSVSQVKMANSIFMAFERYRNELEGIDVKVTEDYVPLEIIKQDLPTAVSTVKDKIIFKVQIETSDQKIPLTDVKFKNIKVSEYKQDNLYKYTVGNYENDFKAASQYKKVMISQGYQHAFVVAFLNGERVSIEKAIKLAEK